MNQVMSHRSSTGLLVGALVTSAVLNLAGITFLYHLQNPGVLIPASPPPGEPLLMDFTPSERVTYVDTPPEEREPSEPTPFISDKSSRADSSRPGEDTGQLPEGELLDVSIQAAREAQTASDVTPGMHQSMVQQAIAAMEQQQDIARTFQKLAEDVTVIEGNFQETLEAKAPVVPEPLFPSTELLRDVDVSLLPKDPVPASQSGNDLFPLPFLSLGHRTLSEQGIDSFNAEGSPLGRYFKTMRDKIGLHFYRMIYFHYRTNYILGSRATLEFTIEPSGYVRDIQSDGKGGDPLFAEYCLSVIRAAAPFAPMDQSLRPYLEDGALKMRIQFGYDTPRQ